MTWFTRLILSALLMSVLGYLYQNGITSKLMSDVVGNIEETESYDYDLDNEDYDNDDYDNSDTDY